MKITFIINGLGLGNSTRCHAIIQYLIKEGCEIDVITSGNGIWYYENKREVENVFEIGSFYYGSKGGKISIFSTILSLGHFIKISRNNNKVIFDILKRNKPDIVISDSNYNYKPVKKLGIPLASLNNADVVFHSYYKFGNAPNQVKLQFYFIEMLDYFYNRIVPDLVLSPSLTKDLKETGGNIHRVGPIVREKYKEKTLKNNPKRAVVMLSGSVFGSSVNFGKRNYEIAIDVIGRTPPDNWKETKKINYHGKIKNTFDLISKADVMVVNGGFSAVSEAFFTRKPVVVVPVPNHAEQWVNAQTIKKLGIGEIGTEENCISIMLLMLENLDLYLNNYKKLGKFQNGAKQSSDLIINHFK